MKFSAKINKIGINPYVFLPINVLKEICKQANKNRSPIPVTIQIEGKNFIQNLIRYKGKWRLYLNMPMRKVAGKDVGETITIDIKFDASERIISMHPKLEAALNENKDAKNIYNSLPVSRQKEILKYINFLKTDEAVDKNVKRAIQFLSGKERFIGRDKPF